MFNPFKWLRKKYRSHIKRRELKKDLPHRKFFPFMTFEIGEIYGLNRYTLKGQEKSMTPVWNADLLISSFTGAILNSFINMEKNGYHDNNPIGPNPEDYEDFLVILSMKYSSNFNVSDSTLDDLFIKDEQAKEFKQFEHNIIDYFNRETEFKKFTRDYSAFNIHRSNSMQMNGKIFLAKYSSFLWD